MEKVLIFDVDGTLTGPRRVMPEDFSRYFLSVVKRLPVYLVSGSDIEKLSVQMPPYLLKSVAGVFSCSGNEFRQDGELVYRHVHEFPQELRDFAMELVHQSGFEYRTGAHVEDRTGSLNISVVGRNADRRQRTEYSQWDVERGERRALIEAIEARFPEYEVHRGGQISVDVSPRGLNKAQIVKPLRKLHPTAALSFFGDNIGPLGNDLPLATALESDSENNQVHHVDDHFHTWQLLQAMFSGSSRVA